MIVPIEGDIRRSPRLTRASGDRSGCVQSPTQRWSLYFKLCGGYGPSNLCNTTSKTVHHQSHYRRHQINAEHPWLLYNADAYSSENLVSFCSFWRQKPCGRTSCHRRRLKNVSLFKVYFFSVAIFNFFSLLCKNNVIFTAVNCKLYDPWGRGSDVRAWQNKSWSEYVLSFTLSVYSTLIANVLRDYEADFLISWLIFIFYMIGLLMYKYEPRLFIFPLSAVFRRFAEVHLFF